MKHLPSNHNGDIILVTDIDDGYYSLYWYKDSKCYKTSLLYFESGHFQQVQETTHWGDYNLYPIHIVKGMDNYVGHLLDLTKEELIELIPEEFL